MSSADNDLSVAWTNGGIFGELPDLDEAHEALSLAEAEAREDGNKTVTPARVAMAWNEIERRKTRRNERTDMLLVERFVDELPELRGLVRKKLAASVVALRKAITPDMRLRTIEDLDRPEPETLREAAAERLRDVALETLADALRRAYHQEIRQVETMRRLNEETVDGWGPWTWAEAKARELLTASRLMRGLGTRLGRAAKAFVGDAEPVADAVESIEESRDAVE